MTEPRACTTCDDPLPPVAIICPACTRDEAYRNLCRTRDGLRYQIEGTCDRIDRVMDSVCDEDVMQRSIASLQAHLEVLYAQLDGVQAVIERDHADDLAYDRERAREIEYEERMLGTWDR